MPTGVNLTATKVMCSKPTCGPLARIHGWRFSLDNQYYKNRFTEATDIVAKRLLKDTRGNQMQFDTEALVAAVDSIVRRYLLSIGYLTSQAQVEYSLTQAMYSRTNLCKYIMACTNDCLIVGIR